MHERIACDFHVHTKRSKLISRFLPPYYSYKQALKEASNKNLKFIGITDHDVLFHYEHERIIPGVEITYKPRNVLERLSPLNHVVGLDVKEIIPKWLSLEYVIEELNHQGAVIVIPHPMHFYRDVDYSKVHYVEAFYSYKSPFNRLMERNALRIRARGPKLFGGSDAHYLSMIGAAYTVLPYCETKEEAVTCLINKEIIGAVSNPRWINFLKICAAN